MNEKQYFVYILTNQRNGTLYAGVTSSLCKRVYEHENKLVKGSSSKYDLSMLVYYEQINDAYEAIRREKNLKSWKREWKMELIEKENPAWKDLAIDLC